MISALLRAGTHATLLAAFVYVFLLFARKTTPATRAWLWWLVSAEFAFGWLISIPVHASIPRAEHYTSVTQKAMAAIAETPDGSPVVQHLVTPWALYILGALWIVGIGWRAAQSIYSTVILVKIAKSGSDAFEDSQQIVRRMSAELGLSAPPRVLTTSELDSPAIFGLFSPILFLPSAFKALPEEEQRMAFTHELAHIRRRDNLLAMVPEIASALFWFFPVTLLARREWVVQRELACDAEVLERTNCKPDAYGEFLLQTVEKQRRQVPTPALGVTSDFRSLKRRLSALSGSIGRPRPGVLSILLVGALALPVASQSPSPDGGLIKNAGFEDGDKAPDGWTQGADIDGVAYIWDTDSKHSGKRSISIKKDASRYFPIAQWSQKFAYDGKGSAVQFSGWVKTANAAKAVLDVTFYGDDDAMLGHHWVVYIGAKGAGDGPSTADWKQMGGVAKVMPGTKSIQVALQDYGPGQIWLDDASAKFVDAPETDPLKD